MIFILNTQLIKPENLYSLYITISEVKSQSQSLIFYKITIDNLTLEVLTVLRFCWNLRDGSDFLKAKVIPGAKIKFN